jgi:sulfide dehydrogenase [flavocytochrome c] flavoprotein chain
MQRRTFLQGLGAAGLGLAAFRSALGLPSTVAVGATGRVVVVGGGMGGTTVAKFLRLWGGAGIDVTLVEPNATYYSNIFSNMVLTGERSLSQLGFNYSTLSSRYGVKVVNASVTSIDPAGRSVRLSNGVRLPYDRLVLSPGIDFEPLPLAGTAANRAKIVHAWKAGAQTTALKAQIQSMTKADTFILTIPPKPYRCPPGPYERACVVADYLKRVKGGGRVVILDANPTIQAEPINFGRAFGVTHSGIITYVPNAVITGIDADTMTVTTNSAGTFKGKVINAIPTHKAGALVTESGLGLANAPGPNGVAAKFAGVDVLTYESTAVPLVHILGDASATTQPKAGHIANAEAKVCAAAIIQLLSGGVVNQSPMTNSSCFTPITKTTASWLSVVFRYDPVTRTMAPTGNGVTESLDATSEHYEDMLKWFTNLMSDTFK